MSALICLAKDFNQLDAVVDPVLHIKANGELLVFMIVVSAVITYCFGPTDFFKNNPIRRMAGYNNPCAAWDSPPALYFASLTYSGVIYCAIRYAILDGQRVNNDLRRSVRAFIKTANWMYVLSQVYTSLIFVVTPLDGTLYSMRLHLGAYLQFVPFRFLCVIANYIEAPKVTVRSWSYLIIYGISTLASTALLTATLVLYKNDGVPVVNPLVAQIIDYFWFICLPLTTVFLPDSQKLRVVTTAVAPIESTT